MAQEIVLFWLVLAGLLAVDNCALVPQGGDHLRFGRRGVLGYDPGTRLQARQRDLVLLNPLNPFDRIVFTQSCIGSPLPAQWRAGRQLVQRGLRAANGLSWLGVAYLAVLAALALASLRIHFAAVLALLALAHLGVWLAALWLLLRHRRALQLGGGRVFSLALEALLVPGYLINLGKRVWYRHRIEVPGLALGLRQLARMSAGDEQEFYRHRLRQRLDEVAMALGLEAADDEADAPGGQAWLREARRCLTTSTAPAGS